MPNRFVPNAFTSTGIQRKPTNIGATFPIRLQRVFLARRRPLVKCSGPHLVASSCSTPALKTADMHAALGIVMGLGTKQLSSHYVRPACTKPGVAWRAALH